MNTNVVITALNAAEPQSHDAQAKMRALLVTWLPDSSSEEACVVPGALALFIAAWYTPAANTLRTRPRIPGESDGPKVYVAQGGRGGLDKLGLPEPYS